MNEPKRRGRPPKTVSLVEAPNGIQWETVEPGTIPSWLMEEERVAPPSPVGLGMTPFEILDRDLKKAAAHLSRNEARFLVDAYYIMQADRIRFGNQIHALSESNEPHELLNWMYAQSSGIEKNVQKALDVFSKSSIVGKWLRSVPGIGPVLASGFIAHIDIEKSETAGNIWSFAGLNPLQVWEKGQKRPWNAALKRLCWLAGESFVKVQNNSNDVYGHLYVARKTYETEKNKRHEYADIARVRVSTVGQTTEAYKYYSNDELPPGHIHARCKRWTVKLFLAHLHHVMYEDHFNRLPPRPYVIEHMGHIHYIRPPFWPLECE